MVTRWKHSATALAVIALLALPSMSFAKEKIRFGVTGFGGFNTYKMSDVNDDFIAFANDSLLKPNGLATLSDIKHGLDLGGGLCAWVTKDILVSAEYERLFARSKADGNYLGTAYTFELKIPANAISLSGGYYFPSTSKARFGLGAGVGYYWTKATVEATVGSVSFTSPDSSEVKGHGIGFHGVGLLDYAATPQVHLGVQVGYRFAKTTELKYANDQIIYKEDPVTGLETTTKEKADWSGLVARGGITFLFGKSE